MKRSIWMTATVLLAIIAAFYRLAPPRIHYHPGTALPVAHAQSTDPCNTGVKTKATLDSTGPLTLVSGVVGEKIYVCDVVFAMASAGSGPSLGFIEGSGATCGTGFTALGVNLYTSNYLLNPVGGGSSTQFTTASGSDLCESLGGSTPGLAVFGYLDYVQQ